MFQQYWNKKQYKYWQLMISRLIPAHLLQRSAPANIEVTVLLSSSPFSLIIINPFALICPVLTDIALFPFTLSENRNGAEGTAARATDSWSSFCSFLNELPSAAAAAVAASSSKAASSASSTSSLYKDTVKV